MSVHHNGAKAPLAALRDPKQLAEMGRKTVTQAGGASVEDFFRANMKAIEAVAPAHVKPERLLRLALSSIRATPRLRECSLASLFGALITCSKLGLEPDNGLGHIYLIPFELTRKRDGQFVKEMSVQVVVGYQGMLELIRRSGHVVKTWSRPVCANDTFELSFGTVEAIRHLPELAGERGELIGVYACAQLKGVIDEDGKPAVQFEYMTRGEVERIRNGSQGYKQALRIAESYKREVRDSDSPWIGHFDEMARKTVLRRLFKWLPKSVEMAEALDVDDRGERGAQDLGRVLEGGDIFEAEELGEEDDVAAPVLAAPAAVPPVQVVPPVRVAETVAPPVFEGKWAAERQAVAAALAAGDAAAVRAATERFQAVVDAERAANAPPPATTPAPDEAAVRAARLAQRDAEVRVEVETQVRGEFAALLREARNPDEAEEIEERLQARVEEVIEGRNAVLRRAIQEAEAAVENASPEDLTQLDKGAEGRGRRSRDAGRQGGLV